jgi:chromosomal replication initiation ATPase DnaA
MDISLASGCECGGSRFIVSTAADRAAALVSREKHVSKVLIFNRSRCRADTARARQLAMYLSHVVLGQSLTAVCAAFGRDRTTVSCACALIEDLRDDPDFDDEVTRLERLLENAGGHVCE